MEKNGWWIIFNLQPSFYRFSIYSSGGNIIFLSSITGYVPFQVEIFFHQFFYSNLVKKFFKGIGAYGVTKTAILGLIKALAMECGPRKIRVNGIAPGIVETEFSKVVRMTGKLILPNSQLMFQLFIVRCGRIRKLGNSTKTRFRWAGDGFFLMFQMLTIETYQLDNL